MFRFMIGRSSLSFPHNLAVFASARLLHPWKAEKSPAFQASRNPGVLKSVGADLSRQGAQVVP